MFSRLDVRQIDTIMLRILFWNTAKYPMRHHLADLCVDLWLEIVAAVKCNEDGFVLWEG